MESLMAVVVGSCLALATLAVVVSAACVLVTVAQVAWEMFAKPEEGDGEG